MPIEERNSTVSLDVYSLDISGRSVRLEKGASTPGVEASFRYSGGKFEMLILLNVNLEGSVALVDYPETMDRVTVINILRNGEQLNEAVQLGEFMDERAIEESRKAIAGIGLASAAHDAFIVSSYENDDADGKRVVAKLLPTEVELGI